MKWVMLPFLVCLPLMAEQLDTRGLSDQQILELKMQAQKMKSQPKVVEEAKEWVALGEMIGKAVGSTAKELNVAVNDFVATPAGMFTVAMIAWKVIGREVFRFFFGIMWLIIGLTFWHKTFYRNFAYNNIEYGKGWWIFRERKLEKNRDPTEGQWALVVISILLIVGSSQLIMWIP